jgi:hypothetical protein
MFSTLIQLELALLDELNHDQLVTMLSAQGDRLGLQFSAEWLETQSLDQLRLFLLATKLLQVLRQKDARRWCPTIDITGEGTAF